MQYGDFRKRCSNHRVVQGTRARIGLRASLQRNVALQDSRYNGVAGLPHHSSLPGQRVRRIYGATLHVCSGVSSKIVDVNCGTYATFATTADGHIFAFGLNNYGQLALPGEQSSLMV